jgi:hypothetical protein
VRNVVIMKITKCNLLLRPVSLVLPSAIFTWEDMTNNVGQREQFVDNCGPQNKAQNENHCAKVFKMFFTKNWWN